MSDDDSGVDSYRRNVLTIMRWTRGRAVADPDRFFTAAAAAAAAAAEDVNDYKPTSKHRRR